MEGGDRFVRYDAGNIVFDLDSVDYVERVHRRSGSVRQFDRAAIPRDKGSAEHAANILDPKFVSFICRFEIKRSGERTGINAADRYMVTASIEIGRASCRGA